MEENPYKSSESPPELRRFQFTIRELLWATFWMAVSCVAWTVFLNRLNQPWPDIPYLTQVRSFNFMHDSAAGLAFLVGISSVGGALGSLFGRPWTGLALGVCLAVPMLMAARIIWVILYYDPIS